MKTISISPSTILALKCNWQAYQYDNDPMAFRDHAPNSVSSSAGSFPLSLNSERYRRANGGSSVDYYAFENLDVQTAILLYPESALDTLNSNSMEQAELTLTVTNTSGKTFPLSLCKPGAALFPNSSNAAIRAAIQEDNSGVRGVITTIREWTVAAGTSTLRHTISVSELGELLKTGMYLRQNITQYSGRFLNENLVGTGRALTRAVLAFQVKDEKDPSSCFPLSPVGSTLDGSVTNRFSWQYSQPVGDPQSGFELAYSLDGSAWTTFASSSASSNNWYDVPANTFPAGYIQWRVRTYSNKGAVVSPWSRSAKIVLIAAPGPPAILSCTQVPRPAVEWYSAEQQGFRLQVGEYDSGLVFGTANSFTVPRYLPDGEAVLRLAVINEMNLWSPWAEKALSISHQEAGRVSLCCRRWNNGIRLSWEGPEGASYEILRDGELLAQTGESAWTDYRCCGKHTYQVRAVLGDAYSLSRPVTEILLPDCPILREEGDGDREWLRLEYRYGSSPELSRSVSREVSLQYYAGREFPVAEASPQRSLVRSFAFSLDSQQDLDRLESMTGRMVWYKDPFGDYAEGVLNGLQISRAPGYAAASFTVTAVASPSRS